MNNDGHIDAEEARAFCAASTHAQRITPVRRLQISDHAAGCPACRALLAAMSHHHTPHGGRAALIKDLNAMKAAAGAEQQRGRDEIFALTNRLDSFPEEHFSPGGTLPPAAADKARGEMILRPLPLRRWWESLRLRPAPLLAAAAVAAVLGVISFARRDTTVGESRVARTVPSLQDGPLTVAADGTLQGAINLTDELRTALVNAVKQRRLSFPGADFTNLRGGSDQPVRVSKSAPIPPGPLDPPAGSVVEDTRPTLHWAGVPEAAGYIVEASSLTTDEMITSGRLPASVTSWQPGVAMLRGGIYRWKVEVLGDQAAGKPAASASLKILGDADENELQRLRSGPRVSRLVLAMAYARLNLRREAKAELQALQAENPDSSLAADLAGSIN